MEVQASRAISPAHVISAKRRARSPPRGLGALDFQDIDAQEPEYYLDRSGFGHELDLGVLAGFRPLNNKLGRALEKISAVAGNPSCGYHARAGRSGPHSRSQKARSGVEVARKPVHSTTSQASRRSMDAAEIYDAAVFGDFDRVEELLRLDPGAVNAVDEYGFTPLHGVAGEDQLEMAEYLIAKGANVAARNDVGITPLHLCAYPGMAVLLVSNGADLEARADGGATPLHIISEHPECIDVMEQLLKLGAAVNAKDDAGHTALDSARAREEEDKIEILMTFGGKRGVDV